MTLQLSEAFQSAFELPQSPHRATIVSVTNAGNWKALYPLIQEKFPTIHLDAGIRFPIVFGGDEARYLKQLGPAGAAEFKQHVQKLLQLYSKVFVFDAQKIECLRANPRCVNDLLTAGRCATLFFRDGLDARVASYFRRRSAKIDWHKFAVSENSVSVISTKLSAQILSESFERVASNLTPKEKSALKSMQDALADSLAPELEDHFLEGSFGMPKLRELSRRKIVSAVLKATTPPYSLKSGKDPIQFFREELRGKFQRHELPVGYLGDVSPNLSFVVKSQKRFSELHAQ